MSTLPQLHTAADVADALQVSPWWVKEQARLGRIKAAKVAGSWRFTAAQVEQLLRLNAGDVRAPAPETIAPRRKRATENAPLRLVAKLPRRAVS